MRAMIKRNWILVLIVLSLAALLAFFVIPGKVAKKIGITPIGDKPYRLGLDLQGGITLLYQADLSQIPKEDWKDSMTGLRDVIERRVNLFGVQEPLVQIQRAGEGYRLIVELAGLDDPGQAIKMIGQTPYLEFREQMTDQEREDLITQLRQQFGDEVDKIPSDSPIFFKSTELTGKYLKKSLVEFGQTVSKPAIGLEFNSEGAKIFEEITGRNVGKPLAIFLDNQMLSAPTVQEKIAGGRAQITGTFTVEEAKKIVRNLNAGALPVPISLISEQSIGPSLGKDSVRQSLFAGIIGVAAIVVFMVLIYRFSGILASTTLLIYGILLLSLFKLIPVTLTLAGIAGFILSLGMAVDANILVFERLREERKQGLGFDMALDNAFSRAWPSIRDGNFTTLGICLILFLFASGFVQGFALTLFIGVIISMFSAMVITKIFMRAFGQTRLRDFEWIWTR